jgi:hypothetical protein
LSRRHDRQRNVRDTENRRQIPNSVFKDPKKHGAAFPRRDLPEFCTGKTSERQADIAEAVEGPSGSRWRVFEGSELIFSGVSNRFPTGIVELLCEPFRFRLTGGMESSNVDEIKIICSRFRHSRCHERHGNNQRQRFSVARSDTGFRCIHALRWSGIEAGLRGSFGISGDTSFASAPRHITELHQKLRSSRQSSHA